MSTESWVICMVGSLFLLQGLLMWWTLRVLRHAFNALKEAVLEIAAECDRLAEKVGQNDR